MKSDSDIRLILNINIPKFWQDKIIKSSFCLWREWIFPIPPSIGMVIRGLPGLDYSETVKSIICIIESGLVEVELSARSMMHLTVEEALQFQADLKDKYGWKTLK